MAPWLMLPRKQICGTAQLAAWCCRHGVLLLILL
jgi:hypothetical protein